MAISLVDPKSGKVYEAADEQTAQAQIRAYGLEPATQEQVDKYDLQKRRGGFTEQLKTIPETALAAGARLEEGVQGAIEKATGFGTAPGLVPEAGSQVSAQDLAPSAFTPEAVERRKANPTAAMIGGSLPAVVGGIAAAPLAPAGVLGVLATEATIGATLGEAGAAAAEERPMSAKGAMLNGAIGAGFAGLGSGLGWVARKGVGLSTAVLDQTMERALQRRVPGALMGEGAADGASLARAAEVAQQRTDSTMSRLDEALANARPSVAKNATAQKTAMRGLAETMREAQPELATRLEELANAPARQQRFRGLLDLDSSNPEVAAALDDLRSDPALWGDKAVAHGQALAAARAARPSGPGAVLDAIQGIDDPAVTKLAGELSQHLDDAGGIKAAQAFRETRSVGAAGNGPELMSSKEVRHYVQNDPKIVDQMRTMAGGGEGENGAFQSFDESFRAVTSNKIKREDFRAFAPELDDTTRAALHAERDAIVDSIPEVVDELVSRGGKKAANRITELTTELSKADTGEIAPLMDQLKQQLDGVNLRAVVDQNDVMKNLKATVDPVVERVRASLQNPRFVGEKMAELQQVRNAAWSDPETGFIHNMRVANELGTKLFKTIERSDYAGLPVMQFDPEAFESLIKKDWHNSKPALEAWAKVLDSAERMAANTAEVGARSAGRTPLNKLQTSIGQIRQIFETQSKRLAARDLAQGGIGALARVESLPIAGKFVTGAKSLLGKERVEALAGSAGSKYMPVPTRSVEEASAALRGARAEAPPVAPRAPVPPPEPSSPPPAAAGAIPLRKAESRVVGEVANAGQNERAAATGEARRAQGGSAEVSALAATAGAGAAGLGAYEAYQQAPQPDPAQVERERALELLEQHAEADLNETAKALADPAYAARWTRQSSELPGTLESFQGLHATLGQAYTERREAILRATQDPSSLVEHMTEAFGDLPAEVGLKAFQMAQYLAAKLPPQRGVTVTRPNGLPPSQLEMRRWALQYQTALDPSTAFDDAKRGRLRHEQVQVLKDVWPERYDELRAQTLIAMGEGRSTVTQRMRAERLFGFREQLDPAFSRRLSAVAAQAYAARGQSAAGAQRAPGKTRIPGAMTPGGIGALQLGASAPLGQ